MFVCSCNNDKDVVFEEATIPYYDIVNHIDKGYINLYQNWDLYSYEEKVKYFSEFIYYGYFLRDMGLIYHFSYDEKAKSVAKQALNIVVQECKYNGRIITRLDKNWFRDDFGRNMRLLFEAYGYLNERSFLNIIEEQVTLWFEEVPQENHLGFKIFPYGIKKNNEVWYCAIDPNQNLILAWLFSELYFCEESLFYHSEILKEAVYNEVEAALSIQLPTGELPLAETYPLVYDSNYGGYSSGILYNICQLWDNPDWNDALGRMGKWLYMAFPMAHPWNVKEDYPNYVQDRFYASNLLERIPAFYAAGISEAYVHEWIQFVISKFPDSKYLLPFKFYSKKSLPSSYVIKGFKSEMGYDAPKIAFRDSKLIVIWRDVAEIICKKEHYKTFPVSVNCKEDFLQLEIIDSKGKSYSYFFSLGAPNKRVQIKVIDYKHPFIDRN